MNERKNGAGARLSGVLERGPLDQVGAVTEVEETDDGEAGNTSKSRGATPKRTRPVESRTTKKIKGRTVYIPDDLFERIIVAAHRRDRTISEYICSVLERQVPDHRTRNAEPHADFA